MNLNLFKKFLFALLFLFSSLYAQQIKITLRVDATDTPKHLLHTEESIETGSGPITLYFPRWIPRLSRPNRTRNRHGRIIYQSEREKYFLDT